MKVYGKNVALEVLKSESKINKIYLSNRFNDKEIFNLIKKNHIRYRLYDGKVMDKMCDGLHQGIIIDIDDVKIFSLEELLSSINKKYPLLILLDHLEDPHNFGAIIRSAEAFGCDGIIIPNDRSVQVNSTVVKTSVGTIEKVKIARVPNLNNCIEKLKKQGFWIVGTAMDGKDYTKIDYKAKIALVIGNEGKGISPLTKKNCDYLASIPMIGTVNSLNASVATGIFLSEIVKSRNN